MRRLPLFAALIALTVTLAAAPAPEAAAASAQQVDKFTLHDWNRIEAQAARNEPHALGLRDGYLAGVRDALRFYTKVAKTFPICWPHDHEIDEDLIRNIVNAVRREHPDIAKPQDNFAYLVVLSLYDTYPCQ